MDHIKSRINKYYRVLTGDSMDNEKNPTIKEVFLKQSIKMCAMTIEHQIKMLKMIRHSLKTASDEVIYVNELIDAYDRNLIKVINFKIDQ